MSESLFFSKGADKEVVYNEIIPQIKALVEAECDLVANLANVSAAIKEVFGHLWVGFYLLKGEEMVLAPFQGPIACTRIKYGRGVCGMAWKEGRTIIVPDVNQFDGHIACSSLSRSEIVIPIYNRVEFVGVFDIDSDKLDAFDEIDSKYLEQIVQLFFK